MAEARSAVAFQFAVGEDGVVVNFDKEVVKLVARSAYKSVKRKYNDTKNTILKGVYPASPATWMLFLAAILAAKYNDHKTTVDVLNTMEKGFPGGHRFEKSTVITLCIITVVTLLWLFTGYFLQTLLRKLLTCWWLLYQSRGPFSLKIKLWVLLVRILSGRNPGLFSFQKSLPYLPVPALHDTLKRYLNSVRPLVDDENYARLEGLARDFEEGIGPKLQRYVKIKSFWASNYVSDWWERYVYLRSRGPNMINSNYYGLDLLYHIPSEHQTSRAANVVYALFTFRKLVNKQRLKPIKQLGIYPLCSWQYERIFNTTRIPGVEEDVLVHLQNSNHIAVYHKGCYYRVTVVFRGKTIKPADIESQLSKIVQDNADRPYAGEEKLAALTAGDRRVWAEMRNKHFASGDNKASLDVIEQAAFVLVLDDEEWVYDEKNSEVINKYAGLMLHGNGYNRWFDKSFTIVVSKNGRVGFNAEHSWADASVMSQMWEWVMVEERDVIRYTEDGRCALAADYPNWPCPVRLRFDMPEECVQAIEEASVKAQRLIDDLDLRLCLHTRFGKGAIKQCNVSPDAFIQVTLQLAYFKDAGKPCLTYEAAMTRLFREGRTETVRSCSCESTEFVKAMQDPNLTRVEKRKLFGRAADEHVKLYRMAMTGEGIDRHLFTLYVVSKYLNVEVPFLREVLNEPWRLSTSQTPVGQSCRIDFNKNPHLVSAGGGFGPVADDGYGVSYIICGDDIISYHVSCKKSCPTTDSKRFIKHIEESMEEVRALLLDED